MIRQSVSKPGGGGEEDFLYRHGTDGWNNRRRLDQIVLRDSDTGLYHEKYFHPGRP